VLLIVTSFRSRGLRRSVHPEFLTDMVPACRRPCRGAGRGEMMVTASIKQPSPAGPLGYWPVLDAAAGGWPATSEIDMLEDVNGLNNTSGTLHS
jgi:hypothetical protein